MGAFSPLFNQLCLFPLVLLKKLADIMFWKAFVLSSTAVVVKSDLARFAKAKKKKEKGKQASNSLTISELFLKNHNL